MRCRVQTRSLALFASLWGLFSTLTLYYKETTSELNNNNNISPNGATIKGELSENLDAIYEWQSFSPHETASKITDVKKDNNNNNNNNNENEEEEEEDDILNHGAKSFRRLPRSSPIRHLRSRQQHLKFRQDKMQKLKNFHQHFTDTKLPHKQIDMNDISIKQISETNMEEIIKQSSSSPSSAPMSPSTSVLLSKSLRPLSQSSLNTGAPNLLNKFRASGDLRDTSDDDYFSDDDVLLDGPKDNNMDDATFNDDDRIHRKLPFAVGNSVKMTSDNVHTTASPSLTDKSTIKYPDTDVVTKFLNIVESQNALGKNCTAGTEMNLGDGVVDRYAQEKFRSEAEVAVNRANFLTRLWKYAWPVLLESEYVLYTSVRSMVEFDEDIFAAGNCYDKYQYKDYLLFCPFGYRLPEGPILVKNLAVEYKYLTNASEWFYRARKSAERVIKNYTNFKRGKSLAYNNFSQNL